ICFYLKESQFKIVKKVFVRDFLNVHKNIAEKLDISFNAKADLFTKIIKERIALGNPIDSGKVMNFERRILSFAEEATCFILGEYLFRKTSVHFSYVESQRCIYVRNLLKGEDSGFDYRTSLEM